MRTQTTSLSAVDSITKFILLGYKDGRKKASLGHFQVGNSLVIPLIMLKDYDASESMDPTPSRRGVTRLGHETAGKSLPAINQEPSGQSVEDKSVATLRQLKVDCSATTTVTEKVGREEDTADDYTIDLSEDDITYLQASLFESNESIR